MELREVERDIAVSVRNAYKTYGSNTAVLRGLDMTIPKGTIYGLLGPSGCGKTTLLRCIVGLGLLDSGNIYVKAHSRENIGYMPQDLSLCEDMTIAETFNYFGRLFGMDWRKIKTRGVEILKFLELPPGNRLIGKLSGGQQRRVSFAIALLHNPQLLILDEPTVGVDPILSSNIWENLIKMANQGKTIVITTHYIEEARQANTIGLMRQGVLLAEESPLYLMQTQNCSSLEQAFLQLSQHQSQCESNLDFTNNNPAVVTPTNRPSQPLQSGGTWCKQRFLAQLVKTFVWNMRNYHMLFFLFILPIIVSFLVNMTIGNEHFGTSVGFVSLELKNGLADCQSREHHFNCTYSSRPLSCIYVESLNDKSLHLKEYQTLESAKTALLDGQVMSVIQFSSNYTESVYRRIDDVTLNDDSIIDSGMMNVWIDMSDLWMSVSLKRDIINDILKLYQDLFVNCDASPRLATVPVRFEEPIFGSRQPSFLHFSVPGLMISFCFYLPVMYTTGTLIAERCTGQLERSMVAGLNLLEVVAAHFLIQFIIMSIQTMEMMFVAYVVYFNPLYGNLLLLLLLILLVENLGMCYAFFLVVVFESEKLAAFASTGTIVVLFTICGIVWPIKGMHFLLQKIAWAIPLQPAVESYRSIAIQSHFLDHPSVYKGFFSTIAWTFVIVIVSYVIAYKRKILR